MSDGAVLAELFGLLEVPPASCSLVPRDAASYRVEVLHLAAIRAHRRERAVSAAHTVSEALAKVTAVVTSATQPAATCAQPAAPCTQPAAPSAQPAAPCPCPCRCAPS
eukprot:scaffold60313_cov31-Phaeocystis_antarctica.AAC.1